MLIRVLLVALSYCGQTLTLPSDAFTVPLDADELHTLYWTLDYDAKTVSLEAHFRVPADNWVALGFSDYGEITDADLCVLRAGQDGTRHVEDTWTDKAGVLYRDKSQDCELAGFENTGKSTSIHFTRKFDTSDLHDYIIEEGTTHVVWASGSGPLVKLDGLNIASAQHGFKRTDLLRNLRKIPMPPDTFTILFTKENFELPPKKESNWCKVIKLPENLRKKHHIVKVEPILPPEQNKYSIIHHIKVSHCDAPPDKDLTFENFCEYGPANRSVCKTTLAMWSVGMNQFSYPEEAGLPTGGPDYNLQVFMNIHYNNSALRDDLVITAGLRVYLTPSLRPYDVGILEMGTSGVMAIPPGQRHFAVNGHCTSACTSHGLPAEGVTVFGTHLHTHRTGRRVVIRHVRDGQVLPDVDSDNHYSTYNEEMRLLKRPVRVLPGDSLVTTCVYDTRGRSKVTWRGETADDEMCLTFALYYPRTHLILCKSRQNLQEMFISLTKLRNQPIFSHLELYNSTKALDGVLTPVQPSDSLCLNANKLY